MSADSSQMSRPRFSAGFYWRTKTGMRFLGWGKPRAERAEASERPWSDLAAWLRMAHTSIPSTAAPGKEGTADALPRSTQSGHAGGSDSEQRNLIVPSIGNLAGA
jgi:hypothetical protein